MNNQLGLGYAGSALIGAGLSKIDSSLNVALILVGAGCVLTIIKAVLDRYGIPVGKGK